MKPKPTQFARFLFEHGIRQVSVASAVGVTPQQISNLARGTTNGSEKTLRGIMRYLAKRLRRSVTREEVFGSAAVDPAATVEPAGASR